MQSTTTRTTSSSGRRANLREQFVDLTRRTISEAPKFGLSDSTQLESFERIARIVESGIFRIVAMGEVKKGKSSFINAFLGLSGLLPTDDDVATSTTFKVFYGETESYQVFFEPRLVKPGSEDVEPVYEDVPPKTITKVEIAEYGTEKANPGNVKGVAFIAIHLPNPVLKEGIALIDTPGLGSLHKQHKAVTIRNVPSADVVFFFVDPIEPIIGKEETVFLEYLWTQTQQIVFIQTKSDLQDSEYVSAVAERNMQILSKTLKVPKESLSYFCVSSHLKKQADESDSAELLDASGFAEFTRFFQNALVPNRDRILLRRFLPAVHDAIRNHGQLLADKLSIANASLQNNRSKLEAYEQTLKEAQLEYEEWKRDTLPAILRNYRFSVNQLIEKTNHEIEDGTNASVLVPPLIELARKQCKSIQTLEDRLQIYSADLAAECNSNVNAALARFESVCTELCRQVTGKLHDYSVARQDRLAFCARGEVSLPRKGAMEKTEETARGAFALMGVFSMFSRFVGAPLGKGILVTAGMATTLTWLAPVTLLGVVMYSLKKIREREMEAAISSLYRSLNEMCLECQREARREFKAFAAESVYASEEHFAEYQKQARSDFENRKQEVENAKKRTAEEGKVEAAQLSEQLRLSSLIDGSFLELRKTVEFRD